jgi:hypothetical protein
MFNKSGSNSNGSAVDTTAVKNTVEITPVSATVSSTLPTSGGYSYYAEKSFDGNYFSWWSPNGDNYQGQWIQFNLDQPRKIYAIRILNGAHYPHFGTGGTDIDLYYMNAILTSATLEFSDGSRTNIEMKVYDGMQTIEFPAVTTSWVKMILTGAVPGKKWQDVSIAEVKFL